MKRTTMIMGNLNILNMLLLAAAVTMFFLLDYPLVSRVNTVFKPHVKAAITVASSEGKTSSLRSIDFLEYASVAEMNMFHPERKVPIEKKEEKLQARPEIILYGTLISTDKKLAYIEDKKVPYSTPGRGQRQLTMDEGSMISGFKLSEVREDSILLTRGDETMVVNLRDRKNRNNSQSQATNAATAAMGAIMESPQATTSINPTIPPPARKPGAATFQMQPTGQYPATIRPKTTIPQRRESMPLRRPNALEYNE